MLQMKAGTVFTIRMAILVAILFTLVGHSAGVASAQADDATPRLECHGEPPTITYIGYDFIVSGTDGDDVIYVEGGWNFVYANDGHDKICIVGHFNNVQGGAGNDIVSADGLYNELSGNDGDDTMFGSIVTNILNGDAADLCNEGGC